MVRDAGRAKPTTGVFGRIDPFCWLLVGSILPAAMLASVSGVFMLGVGMGCLAIAVVIFDAWVNRAEGSKAR